MPSTFPCATCGAPLDGSSFEYQKHMTKWHWSGKNNSFPLPSIFTTTASNPTILPCYFCEVTFYTPQQTASHMITAHGSELHSILCPMAGDDSIRNSVSTFLNDFAASGAAFVGLCDCFPHLHTSTPTSALGKRKRSVDGSGLVTSAQRLRLDTSSTDMAAPSSNITPQVADFLASVKVTPHSGKRVYLRPVRPSAP